jgi:GNAT superfamily N-acetyltransferase
MLYPTYVAVTDSGIAGCYTLRINVPEAELKLLWVKPEAMGKGYGRACMDMREKTPANIGPIASPLSVIPIPWPSLNK